MAGEYSVGHRSLITIGLKPIVPPKSVMQSRLTCYQWEALLQPMSNVAETSSLILQSAEETLS